MTEEQIKQNAYDYTNDHNWIWDDSGESRVDISAEISDAYITGAHSMLEEVKQLEFDKYLHMKRIKTQEEIIAELRNPWISTDKRLPEEDKDNPGYSVTVIGMFASGSISDCFCSLEENIWFTEGLTCDKPTYWMPIPETPKEEK